MFKNKTITSATFEPERCQTRLQLVRTKLENRNFRLWRFEAPPERCSLKKRSTNNRRKRASKREGEEKETVVATSRFLDRLRDVLTRCSGNNDRDIFPNKPSNRSHTVRE